MKLIVAAIGRMRRSPERSLCEDYRTRFDALARPLGLKPLEVMEWEDGGGAKPGSREAKAGEADKLRKALVPGGKVIALDERGAPLPSKGFAERIAAWRDQGSPATTLLIGGAAGLDPDLREDADLTVSFGAATWPHMLARVMVLEQIYRAATILAGHPYHRE